MNTLVEKLSVKPLLTPFQPVEINIPVMKEGAVLTGIVVTDRRDDTADDQFNEFNERLERSVMTKVKSKHPLVEEELENIGERELAVNRPKKTRRKANDRIVIRDEEDAVVSFDGEKRVQKAADKGDRRTKKTKKGVAEIGVEEWVDISGEKITRRMPRKEAPVKIRLSSYYMNNRKIFVNFINRFFHQYKDELESAEKLITCDSLKSTESFSLLTHQKIVRDYLNSYTPYRGLLMYHKLGSGKTCTSIAIAEGMKNRSKVIVMTPKSLRDNYIDELKKCGDFMYKKKQYWEWVSEPSYFETLSSALHLPLEYIERKKGAWLMDVSKDPNTLNTTEMKSLDDQINEMIFSKYMFLAYNGLRPNRLKELTDNYEKNLFDNSVVIIDEAHNFISRIVNKISKERPIAENDRGEKEKMPRALSLKLYEYLMTAKNVRIVMLTGTPIINYPNELGIMFNILRGYIKTWEIPVTSKTTRKLTTETLRKDLMGEKVLDYLEYSPSSKKLMVTRNPLGFKNKIKERSGYHGMSNQKRDAKGDAEFDDAYVSDEAFEAKLLSMLENLGLEVNARNVRIHNYKALPDKLDDFVTRFIDPNTKGLKDAGLFKKRIIGLASYYSSPQEALMPRYEKTPEYYHVVKIPMSNYQFKVYEEARAKERKSEKSTKQKKGGFDKDGIYKEPTSTYRIFSRLFCNFVMPPEIGRPMPGKAKKAVDTGDEKEEDRLEEVLKKAREKERDVDLNNEKEGEVEGDEALGAAADTSYNDRIQKAIVDLKTDAGEYLTKDGLEKYSPKYLSILENIQDPDYPGLHLVYSQFRTLEGIQVLSMVLEQNGFVQFKLKRVSSDGWELDIPEEDMGKPTYALYTGTESDEEKKLILKIYNGYWDDIPVNIANQLRGVANNNNMGEVIKVFMISSSGAEGINLRNTRYVHVTEPYWHPVRLEQVIGRARRICSHKELDEDLQTVDVFVYLMTFTQEQMDSDENRELKRKDVGKRDPTRPLTSDEALYEIASIKEEINSQLTVAIKEAAVDCAFYAGTSKEGIQCMSFGDPDATSFAYQPNIDKDEDDVMSTVNKKKVEWTAIPVTVYGVTYAARKVKENLYKLYDAESYRRVEKDGKGEPILVGTLEIRPDGTKIFNQVM